MSRIARCRVERLREAFKERTCEVDLSKHVVHKLEGKLGPNGLTATGVDLLDIAGTIFRIEHLLPGPGNTDRYIRYKLSMPIRNTSAWTPETVGLLCDILSLLGDAMWEINFTQTNEEIPVISTHESNATRNSVVLFSGGVDSTCGLSTIVSEANDSVLCSYYTRQKTKQRTIARTLGLEELVQWTLPPLRGRGRSFFYRTFYFLSLAAVVAHSWGATRLKQFENGVLAYAIPPSPWFAMTKHSHPFLHQLAGKLFTAIFETSDWSIENPFALLTKRQIVDSLYRNTSKKTAAALLKQTDTCWSHWAPHIHGRRKKPGRGCGVCIPCLVRRTAVPSEHFCYDMRKPRNQNDLKLRTAFQAYYAFAENIITCSSSADFYRLLPALTRELVASPDMLSLDQLYDVYSHFANEFMETFLQ
jgi:7-cyano-7-deazaguanine synthase in queuosine biosynthesis